MKKIKIAVLIILGFAAIFGVNYLFDTLPKDSAIAIASIVLIGIYIIFK